ncbi:MAG: 16S rRNA (cytosine(1402)-N(4))-methyltransferase RsmH [Betaproteobacteria bacterium]|jgi:16S rRNA (cytosine1402-N4)-methyltransferase|nr:16S rRNA (cytosine(1402)-N(4))-methyltransferase RsmH [Betaproteobacteria bacterium]
MEHRTVLLEEAVVALNVKPDGTYVDATYGRGGHSGAILARLGPRGRLVALDRDRDAVAAGAGVADGRFGIHHARFGVLAELLVAQGVTEVDGVLFDLGVSAPQLEEAERGFSFRLDAPLDMRMDRTRGVTAAEWLAGASEAEIKGVIKTYGEERFAGQIAKAIVGARARGGIRTTGELARIVGAAVRTREAQQDPATRTFQAIRIHVNQELEELSLALPQALGVLRPAGRLVVISFHSLEDRIVKRFMAAHARPPVPDRLPLRAHEMPKPDLAILGKPIRPGAAEIAANPRARSAIMRVAEKLA